MSLFLIVVDWSYSSRNSNCNQHSNSLYPSCWPMRVICSTNFDDYRNNTCNNQNSQCEVFEGLAEQLEKSWWLFDYFLVISVFIFTLLNLRLWCLNTFFEISFQTFNKPFSIISILLKFLNFLSVTSFLTLWDDVNQLSFFDRKITHFL